MRGELFNLSLNADGRELEEWQTDDLALVDAVTAYRIRPPIDRAELVAMSYRDYLRSDHWQTQRRRALYRAGFQCKACERDKQLNVHHLSYDRRGREQESDLIVLCLQCHGKVHEMLERRPPSWPDFDMSAFVEDLLREKPWRLAEQHEYWRQAFPEYWRRPPDA